MDQGVDLACCQRPQPDQSSTGEQRLIEELIKLRAARRGPQRPDQQQGHVGQLVCHRAEREQRRLVRPVQVLEHHQHRGLSACPLDQVSDLLRHAVPGIHHGRGRRLARGDLAATGQQSPDRGPAGTGGTAPKGERASDRTERARALEGIGVAPKHRHATPMGVVDQPAHQPGLADPGFTFDQQRRRPATSDVLQQPSGKSELVLSPHEAIRRQGAPYRDCTWRKRAGSSSGG